jgi:hypothetical protein
MLPVRLIEPRWRTPSPSQAGGTAGGTRSQGEILYEMLRHQATNTWDPIAAVRSIILTGGSLPAQSTISLPVSWGVLPRRTENHSKAPGPFPPVAR